MHSEYNQPKIHPTDPILSVSPVNLKVHLSYMLSNVGVGEEVSMDKLRQPKSAGSAMGTNNLHKPIANSFASGDVWNQQKVLGSEVTVLAMVKWSTTRTDLTGSGDEADRHLLGYLR
jgi:hypothetical protein